MTDEELAAIEQRVQAATQGVELFIGRVDHGDDTVEIHRRDRPDRPPFAEVSTWEALGVIDGEFIVHAYRDVPALLAEVKHWQAHAQIEYAARQAAEAEARRLKAREAEAAEIIGDLMEMVRSSAGQIWLAAQDGPNAEG